MFVERRDVIFCFVLYFLMLLFCCDSVEIDDRIVIVVATAVSVFGKFFLH